MQAGEDILSMTYISGHENPLSFLVPKSHCVCSFLESNKNVSLTYGTEFGLAMFVNSITQRAENLEPSWIKRVKVSGS